MSANSEPTGNAASPAPDITAFAIALYGRPGVADACLLLQERCDADVCVVLALCWLSRRGADVADRSLTGRLVAASEDWRANLVLPLRGARRWLKPRSDTAASAELRAAIKKAELSAEFIELEMLAHAAGAPAAAPVPSAPVPVDDDALVRAIAAYLQYIDGADTDVASAIRAITDAARAGAGDSPDQRNSVDPPGSGSGGVSGST